MEYTMPIGRQWYCCKTLSQFYEKRDFSFYRCTRHIYKLHNCLWNTGRTALEGCVDVGDPRIFAFQYDPLSSMVVMGRVFCKHYVT